MHLEMDAEAIRTVYQAVGGFEGLLRLTHAWRMRVQEDDPINVTQRS